MMIATFAARHILSRTTEASKAIVTPLRSQQAHITNRSGWNALSRAVKATGSQVTHSGLLKQSPAELGSARASQAIRNASSGRADEVGLWKIFGMQQRQFRNDAWGRRRSFLPQISDNTALYSLMGANAAVFLLWRADYRFAALNFTTSLEHIRAGRLHTLVTSAFSQRDASHLLSNMIGLYFFGRSVAASIGGKGLIALYLVCGSLGSLVYVVGQAIQTAGEPKYENYFHRASAIPALGSSGAVNGIVMFDILLFPSSTVMLYGVVPMPAWGLGALFLSFDIYGALGHGRQNVGYTVHLAGAAVGALACWGVRRGKIPSRWRRW